MTLLRWSEDISDKKYFGQLTLGYGCKNIYYFDHVEYLYN
jgi:hypothetical protein